MFVCVCLCADISDLLESIPNVEVYLKRVCVRVLVCGWIAARYVYSMCVYSFLCGCCVCIYIDNSDTRHRFTK